jgi:hypothetical protein
MTVKFWEGRELRSKKNHYAVMSGPWMYTLSWLLGLGALVYWRSNLPLIVQALVFILLIFATPSLGDLFYPYSKYQEEWRRDDEQNGVQGGESEAR